MEQTINSIHDAFNYIKQAKFLGDFTSIPLTGGIQHRLAGIGTHKTHQKKDLRPEDITGINQGLVKLANELIQLAGAENTSPLDTLTGHPGKHLQAMIEDLNYTPEKLVKELKSTREHLDKVIAGKRDISTEYAIKLEPYFQLSAGDWLQLQLNHNLKEARKAIKP